MRRDSMKSAPARSARGARRERRLRIVSAAISRPCPSISAASARVLPPPPAQRSITVCPGCASHRSEEHTSELQSLMRISYAVFRLKTKQNTTNKQQETAKASNLHTLDTH